MCYRWEQWALNIEYEQIDVDACVVIAIYFQYISVTEPTADKNAASN